MNDRLAPAGDFDFKAFVRPGDTIAWPQGTGEPTGLSARLMEQSGELRDVTLLLGMVTTPTLDRAAESGFSFRCFSGAANTRKAAALSGNRIIPAHLSEIPRLFESKRVKLDVLLIRVRPTDRRDVFSLGVHVDFVHEMIAAARVVIAEVDERLPRTCGDTLVSRDRISCLVLADAAEPVIVDAPPAESDIAVAHKVAEVIPDGATVQFGVGGMPVAVARALSGHRDLGLHSGVIPDAVVDLLEAGVINNRFKGADVGISVTGGLFGTRRLFDFADGNAELELRRASYTHGSATMATINRFHTINSAIAIDLSGQANSEIAGGRYLGAIGGQVDFVRGGRLSPGGRSIFAMASTTPDGKHSKIVGSLGKQPVTTARSDIDLVVTEFGVADLFGLDFAARSKALIAIAHPDFREALEREAAGG